MSNIFHDYYCDSDIDGAKKCIEEFYNDFRQFYLYLKEKDKDRFEQNYLDMMEKSEIDLNEEDKKIIGDNTFKIKYI